jgi:MoaA/NifB/PqqE/SkfB family radical SAM enzyme
VSLERSYTSANSLPAKLLRDWENLRGIAETRRILPIHPQFVPTNRCNLSCPFCSCVEEDRDVEMDLADALRIIGDLARLGARAVTITGGGDPLMHPRIGDIVDAFWASGIKVGLVTNGTLLHRAPPEALDRLTWCRISNGDFRELTDATAERYARVVQAHPGVDWAFSHVVGTEPNLDEIERVVGFANAWRFTHVRLVPDLLVADEVPLLWAESELRARGRVDLSRTIFQARAESDHGRDCYVGALKPVIGADCRVYACCGVQYAHAVPSKRMPESLCLGSAFDLEGLMRGSDVPLDGRGCARCYYRQYNEVLGALMASRPEHEEFV